MAYISKSSGFDKHDGLGHWIILVFLSQNLPDFSQLGIFISWVSFNS